MLHQDGHDGAGGCRRAAVPSLLLLDGGDALAVQQIFRGVRGSRTLPGRLSTNQVVLIIKARAKAVGLDPKVFAGHSLRSGFVTSAADSGASLQSIADHAAHKKLDTTLGYVQIADAFRDHSGKRFL
jgi:integrase